MTNSGAFEQVIDPSPLILIEVGDPGVPELLTILKPATLPCKAATGEVVATPSISSEPITTVLLVDRFKFLVVIPVTTTSSS